MNPMSTTILHCNLPAHAEALPDYLAEHAPFLPLTPILPHLFLYHPHFQYHAIFLAAPPTP
jgi:hypothetical protein